jgi:hypothetical protein
VFTFEGGHALTVYQTDAGIKSGLLSLSEEDTRRLDDSLRFYRDERRDRGHCTTVDRVSFAQYHGGRRVASESFEDASCTGVLSFSGLARGLRWRIFEQDLAEYRRTH